MTSDVVLMKLSNPPGYPGGLKNRSRAHNSKYDRGVNPRDEGEGWVIWMW
jgi:hypothetical protein